jgi:hypothetical protein
MVVPIMLANSTCPGLFTPRLTVEEDAICDSVCSAGGPVFDPTLLLLSLVPGGIGFVLFTYGRKQGRAPQIIAGLLLLAYPYFVQTTLWMTLIGLAILGGLYWALALGW